MARQSIPILGSLAQRSEDGASRRVFTQEAFAEVCGLHRTYVGAIERGERNVSIDDITHIADPLRVPIGELIPMPRAKKEKRFEPEPPDRAPTGTVSASVATLKQVSCSA